MASPAHAHSPRAGFSEAELREKLLETLKTNGTLGAVKSQLRNRMLQELRKRAPCKTAKDNGPSSLTLRAIESLIVDHLQSYGYDCTLSVFLPESGNEAHTAALQRLQQPGFDSAVQTDPDTEFVSSHLDSRLLEVERDFAARSKYDREDASRGTEQRLLDYQRQTEQRIRAQVEEEITRFRATESARIRGEEALKCRQQLDDVRAELERSFAVRDESSRRREADNLTRLRQRETDLAAENHTLRQQLMECLDNSPARLFKNREAELEQLRAGVRTEFEKDFAQQIADLDLRERKLRDELALVGHQHSLFQGLTEQIKMLQDSLRQRHEDLGARSSEVSALQEKLARCRDYDAVVRDAAVVQNEARDLRDKLSLLQLQSDNQISILKSALQEKESRIAELMKPSVEIVALRDSLHKCELDLNKSRILLDVERARCSELGAQLEAEQTKVLEGQRELAELRQLLHRAYSAISVDPRLGGAPRLSDAPAAPKPLTVPASTAHVAAAMAASPLRRDPPIVEGVRRRLNELSERERDYFFGSGPSASTATGAAAATTSSHYAQSPRAAAGYADSAPSAGAHSISVGYPAAPLHDLPSAAPAGEGENLRPSRDSVLVSAASTSTRTASLLPARGLPVSTTLPSKLPSVSDNAQLSSPLAAPSLLASAGFVQDTRRPAASAATAPASAPPASAAATPALSLASRTTSAGASGVSAAPTSAAAAAAAATPFLPPSSTTAPSAPTLPAAAATASTAALPAARRASESAAASAPGSSAAAASSSSLLSSFFPQVPVPVRPAAVQARSDEYKPPSPSVLVSTARVFSPPSTSAPTNIPPPARGASVATPSPTPAMALGSTVLLASSSVPLVAPTAISAAAAAAAAAAATAPTPVFPKVAPAPSSSSSSSLPPSSPGVAASAVAASRLSLPNNPSEPDRPLASATLSAPAAPTGSWRDRARLADEQKDKEREQRGSGEAESARQAEKQTPQPDAIVARRLSSTLSKESLASPARPADRGASLSFSETEKDDNDDSSVSSHHFAPSPIRPSTATLASTPAAARPATGGGAAGGAAATPSSSLGTSAAGAVDGQLQKYMDMVLEQRKAAQQASAAKTGSQGTAAAEEAASSPSREATPLVSHSPQSNSIAQSVSYSQHFDDDAGSEAPGGSDAVDEW